MKFQQWLESIEDESKHMNAFPASSEVIKTGLQPQVDSEEINTKQKEEHDKLLAIDGQIKRLGTVADQLTSDEPNVQKIKDFLIKLQSEWEGLRTNKQTKNHQLLGSNPNPIAQ